MNPAGRSTGELIEALRHLLRRYHNLDQPPPALAALRCYKNLHDSSRNHAAAQRTLLDAALTRLAARNPPAVDLLNEHYKDGVKMDYLANLRGVEPSTVYKWQKDAITELDLIVQEYEAEAQRRHIYNLGQRFPLADLDHLVGVAAHTAALGERLARPGPPWLLAVTGIGGIGKSTLAAATALTTVQDGLWDNVAWLSARAVHLEAGWSVDEPYLSVAKLLEQLCDQLLPGQPKPAAFDDGKALFLLREHCQRERCLIVVDNLESVAAVRPLLPVLRSLVKPSKVLICAREKLYKEPDILDYAVPELSEADALALLRTSVGEQLDLADIDDAALYPVYAVAGGNPQALRVVGGQLVIFGLDEVVTDLREMRSRRIEQLYERIYRRAWSGLNDSERHVLLTMAVVDSGGETLDSIVRLADLEERLVLDGIETLVVRNLVERRRQDKLVRYTIHNLTRTFLYQQIVNWDADAAGKGQKGDGVTG
jgi:hypothetical protein